MTSEHGVRARVRLEREREQMELGPNDRTTDAAARGPRSRVGVTFLELLIALLLLAFGMLSMTAAQMHAMRGGRANRRANQAASIAENRIEQLQRQDWDAIPPANWTAPILVSDRTRSASESAAVEQSFAVQCRRGSRPLAAPWSQTSAEMSRLPGGMLSASTR